MQYRVAALTEGRRVPSARVRVRQLVPNLRSHGVVLKEFCSIVGKYPPSARWARPFWFCAAVAEQIPRAALTHGFDAVLLQRELISSFAFLEYLTKKPRILDVDDAIFVHRGGHFARRLARMCDRVICGNVFLADWFGQLNTDIAIVPSAVDTNQFVPRDLPATRPGEVVIGWIGTSGNLKYLRMIEEPLRQVLHKFRNARLRVVSDAPPTFLNIDGGLIDFVRWDERSEVSAVQGMDIGVMPLEDSIWARGKCSYKMLQYMACGLPVIASPVGMNSEILALGDIGIAADSLNDWTEALTVLLSDRGLCHQLGVRGRNLAKARFSLEVVGPMLAKALKGR